jgi:hypothetical protein
VSKYRDSNIRICRPHQLTAPDRAVVVNHAIANVGHTYDLKNLFDLARYFLPVSIVPARLRRQALEFGSTDPTRVICSSMIAECFGRVRFPIVPRYEPLPAGTQAPPSRTPRDFDLSPYFEIIKFNVIESSRFDYHKLRWVEEPGPAEAPAPGQVAEGGAAKIEKSAGATVGDDARLR